MLTAQVAYNTMSATTKQTVDELIGVLAPDYAQSPDFVTAACWPDDLKALGVTQYNNWHFVDLPVFGGPIWMDVPAVGNTSNNPWAVTLGIKTLSSPVSSDVDKAIQLRFIDHFVGDLHQPLHAASFFSMQYLNGDAGGNAWDIAGVNQTNLHSFWDSGAGPWATDLTRPLNATGKSFITGIAADIMAEYPQSYFTARLANTNVWSWAVESNAIARDFVYTAPQDPTPLPAPYVSQAQQLCRQQVALGGYRLAQLLESVFDPASPLAGKFMAEVNRQEKEALAALGAKVKAHRLRAGRN